MNSMWDDFTCRTPRTVRGEVLRHDLRRLDMGLFYVDLTDINHFCMG